MLTVYVIRKLYKKRHYNMFINCLLELYKHIKVPYKIIVRGDPNPHDEDLKHLFENETNIHLQFAYHDITTFHTPYIMTIDDSTMLTIDITEEHFKLVDTYKKIYFHESSTEAISVYPFCDETAKYYLFGKNDKKYVHVPKGKYGICAIAKKEHDYIPEWIEHHLSIGFDIIYFYDNNDVGDDRQLAVLQPYIDQHKVVYTNIQGARTAQMLVYNLAYNICDCMYMAFIDLDEFIVFNPDQSIQTIDQLMTSNYIHLSWEVYGDNDLVYKDDRPCLERFATPLDHQFCSSYSFPENYHVKSILRTDLNIKWKNPHYPVSREICRNAAGNIVDGSSPFMTPDYSVCWIKHFYTKTAEEYIANKFYRTHADTDTGNFEYDMNVFFKYNKKTPDKLALFTQKTHI